MNAVDILSFQLYSLRRYRDLPAQLDLLAGIGYRQVETIMPHYDDAAGTRRLLDDRGLAAPTGHFSMAALRERPEWIVAVAREIGLRQIVMPALPEGEREGDAGHWRRVGAELGGIARRLAGSGLTLAYHNHDWELAVLEDGRTALEHLFDGAEGTPLRWQVDVAWLVRGGGDLDWWIGRHGDRIVSCHVKDMAPEGENAEEDGWADVGDGVLPWDSLWRACRGAGAEWMVVEHDNPQRFKRFAERSFAALRALPA